MGRRAYPSQNIEKLRSHSTLSHSPFVSLSFPSPLPSSLSHPRRYKFLSHLPLTSLFSIAEVDLRSVVSAQTHRHFAGDLKRKEMGRRKAAHDECVEREREREREEKERVCVSNGLFLCFRLNDYFLLT